MKAERKSFLLYFFSGFIAGALVVLLCRQFLFTTRSYGDFKEARRGSSDYALINPLLECEPSQSFRENALYAIREKIENFHDTVLASKKANHLSVYYRDLNNGPWFAVNEDEAFYPASLYKVPVLISALYRAERDSSFLNKKVFFEKSDAEFRLEFPPKEKLIPGNVYSIKELLEHSIIYSDNDATVLVGEEIGEQAFLKTYSDLGISVPDKDLLKNAITPKNYGTFFRVLYNASYLNPEFSEAALKLLTLTDFDDGLVAGVPSGTIVAHKFGERRSEDGKEMQLHDCGIVYHPKRPYMLCVMTRGGEVRNLSHIIATVSQMIWDTVDQIDSK